MITFTFTTKHPDESTKVVSISKTIYEARINKRLFDGQTFDQEYLALGKGLVADATFDFFA